MLLPLTYLLDFAGQYFSSCPSPEEGADFLMNPPYFYHGENLIRSGTICLCRGSELDPGLRMELGSLLVCDGPPPFSGSGNVCLLKESTCLETVSNLLHQLFKNAGHWEEKLTDLSLSRAPLSDLLALGMEYLHNPIGIMNPEFKIIADYGREFLSAADKPEDSDDLQADIVNSFKNDTLYQEVEQYRQPFIFPKGALPYRSLCVNLFYKEAFTGRLSVLEYKSSLHPWDSYFLETLKKYVLPLYISIQAPDGAADRRKLLTRQLLKGDPIPEQEFLAFLQETDWLEKGNYLCACIYPSEADFANHTLDYFSRVLERTLPGALCVAFSDKIGMLTCLDSYPGGRREFEEHFVYSIRESNFRTGLSRTFQILPEASFAYRQSEIALEIGLRQNPQIWKHSFDDYATSYLIQSCIHELPARFVCSPALLLLRQKDRETGSDYYHTLKTWLEHGQNTVQTARDLFIHRGTLIYRLEKITEMTGIDLNSWEEQMYLLLSFQLLETPVYHNYRNSKE